MRVLALTRYASLGASSRLRILQYRKSLAETGVELIEAPFFRDNYIRALYRGERNMRLVANGFGRRFVTLIRERAPDAIWLEKEALPWTPWFVEQMLLPRSVPLIVDYDDAVFHRYDMHVSSAVRRMLGRKIDAVMARADIVVVGNDYLADRARKAGATDIEIIPTVVNHQRYRQAVETAGEQMKIGWIGSPSTAKYLGSIAPVFRQLLSGTPVELLAIGARQDQLPDDHMKAIPWTEESEVDELGRLSVGIMPLPDEPWERGKCGYKLIQYMACGLPVVASPVGVNAEIVRHGVTGFLAQSESEWKNSLRTLINDPSLRRCMGTAGRALVESKYSVKAQLPRLETLFRRIALGSVG